MPNFALVAHGPEYFPSFFEEMRNEILRPLKRSISRCFALALVLEWIYKLASLLAHSVWAALPHSTYRDNIVDGP